MQITFLKDIYKENYLRKLDLNDRQIKSIQLMKNGGKITKSKYQKLFEVSRITATKDLTELVEKGIIKHSGDKGAGSYYQL